jgi:hypothetical protein
VEDCKPLLPVADGAPVAIFVEDFQNDMKKLAAFLKGLSANQTLYEQYRTWRRGFDPRRSQRSPLLQQSWPCRVCEWAVRKAGNISLLHM